MKPRYKQYVKLCVKHNIKYVEKHDLWLYHYALIKSINQIDNFIKIKTSW